MRYKVRAPDDASFESLLERLQHEGDVTVFAASPRRRVIGTGDLSDGWQEVIRSQGGEITADEQYDLE